MAGREPGAPLADRDECRAAAKAVHGGGCHGHRGGRYGRSRLDVRNNVSGLIRHYWIEYVRDHSPGDASQEIPWQTSHMELDPD